MRLDKTAFNNTVADIKSLLPAEELSQQDNKDLELEVKTSIELYIKHLNATTKDQSLTRLANANNALSAVVDTCAKAQASIAQLACKPEQTELRDAFVHYLQVVANQAAVYLSGDPN